MMANVCLDELRDIRNALDAWEERWADVLGELEQAHWHYDIARFHLDHVDSTVELEIEWSEPTVTEKTPQVT